MLLQYDLVPLLKPLGAALQLAQPQDVVALLVELQYALAPLLKQLGVEPQLVVEQYVAVLLALPPDVELRLVVE